MMRLRIASLWILSIVLCATVCAHAEGGSITGTVHDGEGKPLNGVKVTLAQGKDAPAISQTMSGSDGQYRFVGLAPGEYTVTVELAGYTPQASPIVQLKSGSASAIADLTLLLAPVSDAAMPAPSSRPALKFQASGIRGLIDPGGYSASTSGAASGLLRGIADVKRTDKSFGISAAKDWPCSLEPELQKNAAAHPDQSEANRRLGQFYLAHQQPGKALPLLKRAVQIGGADYAASRDLSIALLQSGVFDEARKLLTELVEHHDKAEVHQLLARTDEGSGMFRQAAQEYAAADKQELSEESVFGHGYELILAGAPIEAIPIFRGGEQRYPHSIALRIGLGTAQFLVGHSSEALRSFLDATDIDPTDARSYGFLVASVGAWGDDSVRIRSSLKRYVDRKPESAAANYDYAMALSRADAGSNENAEAGQIEPLLKRAIQLDPTLAKAHLQLADLLAERNDFAGAITEYEATVRLAPDTSEAHYRLAIAYKRSDHAEQSAREMQFFQQAKARESAKATGEGVNLAQFISVMDAPQEQPGMDTQCASSSR